MFNSPKAPAPPPPPPAPTQMASTSVMQQGAAERSSLANAEGAGLNGTDVTGPEGAANPSTTKTLLGS